MAELFLSQAKYAALYGKTRKAASDWKRKGLLVFTSDGLVDVAASDKRRAGHGVDVTRRVTKIDAVTAQPDETPEEAAERLTLALSEHFPTKADAEKVKETYLALLRKLEFDEKSGEVVRISVVTGHVGEEYARVRSRFMSLPAEVAPELAAMKSAEEVRDCLEREVTVILRELSIDDGRVIN